MIIHSTRNLAIIINCINNYARLLIKYIIIFKISLPLKSEQRQLF